MTPGEAQQRSERKHLVETCEESLADCRWLVDGSAAGDVWIAFSAGVCCLLVDASGHRQVGAGDVGVRGRAEHEDRVRYVRRDRQAL